MLRAAPAGLSGLEQVLDQVDVVRDAARRSPSVLRAFFVLSFETDGRIGSLRPWIDAWLNHYELQTAEALREGQHHGSVDPTIDPEAEAEAGRW